ncbi:TetR/AcrR family transcriptional regulator (plasmid) [Erythrobacteraceae bacterium WH01K]|nr:TetR/AcrR family transcriptional regulator [Erythrobacteraceae bacterium WH01K]
MDKTHLPQSAKERLLDAAVMLIRRQGFAGTSVDQLCAAAGVTKGAFFHHFASKEELGIAAAGHWVTLTAPAFEEADYQGEETPLKRLLAYLDLRAAMITGDTDAFTCLAGTLAQEVHQTHPRIARASDAAIRAHSLTLENDIAAALAEHGLEDVDPASLALHIQAVLQGSFVLAKAAGDPAVARDSVHHLKRYILLMFNGEET